MKMYDIIVKKRNGKSLTEDEIRYLVNGYVKGEIPDYQMSAFLMTLYFQNMNEDEIFYLTDAMLESGNTLDWSGVELQSISTAQEELEIKYPSFPDR